MSHRIYTRTGDDGSTGLFGGERVAKSDLRIDALGAVDELNAHLGAAASLCDDAELAATVSDIQHDLFSLGADLATPLNDSGAHGSAVVSRMTAKATSGLEAAIDRHEEELPPLRWFILPGGTRLASQLHVCRAVCRRAERRVVALSRTDATNVELVRYLNRLSDLLFVLARVANARADVEDIAWSKGEGDV